MRLQIVVANHAAEAPHAEGSSNVSSIGLAAQRATATKGARAARDKPRPAREVIDIFVDGANVTARVRETHGAFVLRDLAFALVELGRRPRGKVTVRFYDEPWELCVERFGTAACLSVYRAGPDPLIAVYDRQVLFDEVVAAACEAIDQLLSDGQARGEGAARLELVLAAEQLRAIHPAAADDEGLVPELVPVVIEPNRDSPLSFGAEFALRDAASGPRAARFRASPEAPVQSDETVERSDMHALLFRGRVWAEIRGRSVDLGDCHPLLLAERLLELARRAFDAWERGLALHARGEAAGVVVGVRLSPEGELSLTLGPAVRRARSALQTFPALGVDDVLNAALAFGRAVVRAILRRDRSQSANLRLAALRRTLREATDALRQASQTDSKINPSPELYRALAAAIDDSRAAATPPPSAIRLRYADRWRAIVPGIDLRATYLCGDRLIVGASTEMWALDRASGKVIWRADVSRGTSVVTPGGVARLAPDGTLSVYDFGTGSRTLRTRIAPRAGGPVAGAVVHLPGLPKLVVVTEGEHHLVAIDLGTGEPRWRWSWGAGRGATRGVPRMKRAGRLVYFTCGDGALTALDAMTGAVVWRLRDRLRFRTPPTVVRDALFVVSGGVHGVARLYCVDPYSGHVRWQTLLAEPSAPCTVDGAPLAATPSVAVALRQKTGIALAAFHIDDGAPITAHAPPPALATPIGTSWLAVDDAFIGNTPAGELVAMDGRTGELRWRCVLGPQPLEADIPRRLEPVLRCGALFVPCSLVAPSNGKPAAAARRTQSPNDAAAAGVCILRPNDGAMIGAIAPTEVIPDLLRVDEHCNVYVAEESGHISAFGALPKLRLV